MILCRHARPEDVPGMAEVHVQANWETYRPLLGPVYEPPGVEERTALWREALTEDGAAFVALDGDRVVGFAHALGDRLTTLYVLASHHRRGIGRRLLTMVREVMRARGIERIRFDVLEQNLAAIAFYEAHGAVRVGRVRVEDQFGVSRDLVFEIAAEDAAGVADTPPDGPP